MDIPVAHSEYWLEMDEDVHYRSYQIGLDSLVVDSSQYPRIITWEISNLPKYKSEDALPPKDRFNNTLFFAPDRFQLKYPVISDTWQGIRSVVLFALCG